MSSRPSAPDALRLLRGHTTGRQTAVLDHDRQAICFVDARSGAETIVPLWTPTRWKRSASTGSTSTFSVHDLWVFATLMDGSYTTYTQVSR